MKFPPPQKKIISKYLVKKIKMRVIEETQFYGGY